MEFTEGPAAGQQAVVVAEDPAKLVRIGTMARHLLAEMRTVPLDDRSLNAVREVHMRALSEVEHCLGPELRAEMEGLAVRFPAPAAPSEAELRIAHAQLVGWLEGLFQGIQAALVAQQMAAHAELTRIRQDAQPIERGEPDGDQAGRYL